MDEIYIIIQHIGDFTSVVDKAYWYYGAAEIKASELLKESHSKGYTDFRYSVQPLDIEGLK